MPSNTPMLLTALLFSLWAPSLALADEPICLIVETLKVGTEFDEEAQRGPTAFTTVTTEVAPCKDTFWKFVVDPAPHDVKGRCAPVAFPPRTQVHGVWWSQWVGRLSAQGAVLTESTGKLAFKMPKDVEPVTFILELDAEERVVTLEAPSREFRCEYRYDESPERPLVVHCEPTTLAAGMDSAFWDYAYSSECLEFAP